MTNFQFRAMGLFACVLFLTAVMQSLTGCNGSGGDNADSPEYGQDADDDLIADDDAADDADDDVDDDAARDMPTRPNGHDGSWDCYLCHEADFLGATGEPHGGVFDSPDRCTGCHGQGSWNYANPDAPAGHGATEDCLNCHGAQHDKPWTDMAQCLVCHQPGEAPPVAPNGHGTGWDCYICHAQDFNGASGEPHGHSFDAPADCLNCHTLGTWIYTNPDAPEGHGAAQDCLTCHAGQHDKTWQEMSQCIICHQEGTSAPSAPQGHDGEWDCYLCHAADFLGANGEPHGHGFAAPSECLNCHTIGTWAYTNDAAPEDHGSTQDCLICHGAQHGKSWTDQAQCMVCHQTGSAPPTYPTGHQTVWDCYICHDQGFLSAPGEPHSHGFGSPTECVSCHVQGSWNFTDPNAPADHGSDEDCLGCHGAQHDRPWTDQAQCFVCHLSGGAPPTKPAGHNSAWDCYICHFADFLGALGEPHSGGYVSPTQCNICHASGVWIYDNPNAPQDHGSTDNCLNCHAAEHGRTWTDFAQCFVCHDRGVETPTFPTGHGTAWDCYICHEAAFLGANGEPHNHQHSAPSQCLACHQQGAWDYTNAGAPSGHGSTGDCRTCHTNQHGKTWGDPAQCLVCHLPGNVPPTTPNSHEADWSCYICHAADFLGAVGEPHAGHFTAPVECMQCHSLGSWVYTNPDAPEGHGSSADCLTCHGSQHGKTWDRMSECFACHQAGSAPPTASNGHDAGWDCYLCHTADFLGALGEPHGGQFDSPVDCLLCHTLATWIYTNPNAPAGHGSTQNCLNCHQGQHAKNWTDPAQCRICHAAGNAPPTACNGHNAAWDCYLCHAANFNGAVGEPHSHEYGSPAQCLVCHTLGTWAYTNPNAPDGHGTTQNCLNCHQGMHSKTWTDMAQCKICHQPGVPGPQYPNNHNATWNCYICHAAAFNGSPREPHNHAHTAPSECLVCHQMGNFLNPRHGPTPEDDHRTTWDCTSCHGNMHGKTWQDRYQCQVCHQI